MTANPDNNTRLSLPRCVVIIPAHNEAQNIGSVIGEVHRLSDFPVVVVDDASTDDTIRKAREAHALVIPLVVQLGAWGANQAGLRYALKNDYAHVITMDADGQHQASSLPALLQPIIDKQADVTIIDPDAQYKVDVARFRSKSRNCPYHGWELRGKVEKTIVGGEIRFSAGD